MENLNVPKKVNRHVLKAVHYLAASSNNAAITFKDIMDQVRYQMRNLVPVQHLELSIKLSLDCLTQVGLIKKSGRQFFVVGNDADNKWINGDSRKRPYSVLNTAEEKWYNSEDSSDMDLPKKTRLAIPEIHAGEDIYAYLMKREQSSDITINMRSNTSNHSIRNSLKLSENSSIDIHENLENATQTYDETDWGNTDPSNIEDNKPKNPFRPYADSRRNSYSVLDPNTTKRHHSKDSLSGDEIENARKRLRTNKKLKRSGSAIDLPKAKNVKIPRVHADMDIFSCMKRRHSYMNSHNYETIFNRSMESDFSIRSSEILFKEILEIESQTNNDVQMLFLNPNGIKESEDEMAVTTAAGSGNDNIDTIKESQLNVKTASSNMIQESIDADGGLDENSVLEQQQVRAASSNIIKESVDGGLNENSVPEHQHVKAKVSNVAEENVGLNEISALEEQQIVTPET